MEKYIETGIYSKQAHVNIPEGLYEEEHGRRGFFGKVSHLYHQNPPVGWTHIDGPLKPQALPNLYNSGLKSNCSYPLLFNNDLTISLIQQNKSFSNFFRNADGDEIFFIHNGVGRFETIYGELDFKTGDYLVIPRGTTYKLFVDSEVRILKIESKDEVEQPNRGLLGPNALYDQSMIKTPVAKTGSQNDSPEYKVEIKRLNQITTATYPFNPLDVVGWKGNLFPWKISIYDFCPVMSHRYHVPPSAHTTLLTRSFVVCSFVERPLEDGDTGALKVPFYHSNIDFDEVIFYHKGSFFSRDNIEPGAMTFHPQGIHHGPHPKAFKNSNSRTHTDEFAVMIDSRNPLQATEWFNSFENKDYWKSWQN